MSEVKLIPLRAKDGGVLAYALVDASDFAELDSFRWSFSKGRARRRGPTVDGKQTTIYMHRQIMGLAYGDPREVDHRNHNELDNRRSNLRVVTHAENHHNQFGGRGISEHRGVTYDKSRGKWRAQLFVGGRSFNRYCDTEEEAARIARELRGEHMSHTVEEDYAA